VLERERGAASDTGRIVDLVWASVTEELLGVRSRVERWASRPTPTPDLPA
jgi:hypothetical protein